MGFGDGVARGAHVEEDTAVFKHSGGGVRGQIGFDDSGQLRGRGDRRAGFRCSGFLSRRDAGVHGVPLPRHALAQAGDVGDVMARVPLVEREIVGQSHAPALGMNESLVEVIFRHGLERATQRACSESIKTSEPSMGRRESGRRAHAASS